MLNTSCFFRRLTISYTVDLGKPVILIISEGFRMLLSHNSFMVNRCISNSKINIDLTTLDTVFDEDVEYANSPKDEIDTRHPKGRKIYIEMSQDCKDLEKNVKNTLYKAMNHYWNVPNKYAMIGTLLDLRYKEL
ncbi:hypothetical protein RclHR1_11590009 [Rhizophagus clarus]|uniref:Uncharacterized protein n=1 Tax=Rhizophagus clarus TaxID=94130 RepID=A0A2Z6Q619_9GLOM|nr:hypothetical protein RclHR1_11590009 [Rhizophagus clarus]